MHNECAILCDCLLNENLHFLKKTNNLYIKIIMKLCNNTSNALLNALFKKSNIII